MSKTKNKPELWKITEYCSGTITVRTPTDFVCRCNGNEKGRKYSKLIAAIPVMLDALQKIAGMDAGLQMTNDEEGNETTCECNQCNNMIWIANAALKKCGVEK